MSVFGDRRAGGTEPLGHMPAGPLFANLLRALFLQRDFFERVAADPVAARPAIAVVCLSSLAYGGTLMPVSPAVEALAHTLGYWILPLLMALGLVRWVVYTAILWAMGSFVSRTRQPFGRLLRCVGFAQTPAILSLAVLFDASAAAWLQVVIRLWLLAATIAAVRGALQTGLARATAIGVLGYVLDALLPQLVATVLLVAMAGH
jgi:hypothetical protein